MRRCDEALAVLARTLVRPVAVVVAMNIPRCTEHPTPVEGCEPCKVVRFAEESGNGSRGGGRTAWVHTRKRREPKSWRCKRHLSGYVVPGCKGCEAEQRALLAIAQKRDRVPRTLARKSRAWHAAGGGTEQFDLAEYERLMR